MQNLISKIKARKGLIDFVLLASGSMLGQGMAILFAPILSRIYTEEQMGTYTLLLTAVGMFESAICLRYDLIIVSEKKERYIKSIAFSCLKITVILSIIITIGYTLYLVLSEQLDVQSCWVGMFILPTLLCGGIILVLTAINNRNRAYKNIACASLAQGFVHNGLSTIMGVTHLFGFLGLIVGRIIGCVSYIIIAFRTQGIKTVKNDGLLDKKTRKKILIDNKKQALYSAPAVVLSCLSYSIINIFLSKLYGKSVLGLYSYSYRLLGLPLTVISANISRMFFKDAAIEYQTTNCMRKSFEKLLIPLLTISIFMVVLFKIFAPTIFSLFLGERWKEAGVFVSILAPMYGIRLLSNSFTNATIVSGKQFISLILQMLYLLAISTVYLICKNNSLDVYVFLKIMNIVFCIIYSLYFVVLMIMCIKKKEIE